MYASWRLEFWRVLTRSAAIVIVLASSTRAKAATPIVNSGGFESFNLAPLGGQNQWVETPGGDSTAEVQSTVVSSGGKAVKVTRAAGSDKRWADEVSGYPNGRFVVVDWDMYVNGTESTSALGPFFGVEAYDGFPVTSIGLIGSLGVDATTGEVLYQKQGTGELAATGGEVSFDSWQRFRLLLDFNLKKYSGYLNGTKLITEGFVDEPNIAGGLTNFTDADISALAAFGDSASLNMTGTAYFDNFRVWSGIPEDFFVDNLVNGADFNSWKTAFGPSNAADADGDADSDGADFLAWQRAFGFVPPTSTAVSAALPEPTGAALLTLAGLGVNLGRCGRRRRGAI